MNIGWPSALLIAVFIITLIDLLIDAKILTVN